MITTWDLHYLQLVTFMSVRDIPWCLGGDFNNVRFPSDRSTRGRMSSAVIEFSDFIGSCSLIDLTLGLTVRRFHVISYSLVFVYPLVGIIICSGCIKVSLQLLKITF